MWPGLYLNCMILFFPHGLTCYSVFGFHSPSFEICHNVNNKWALIWKLDFSEVLRDSVVYSVKLCFPSNSAIKELFKYQRYWCTFKLTSQLVCSNASAVTFGSSVAQLISWFSNLLSLPRVHLSCFLECWCHLQMSLPMLLPQYLLNYIFSL